MKIGLKDKELHLIKEVIETTDEMNINQENELIPNNDQSSTKEDENNIIFDDPIEYCSSPKIGLVSIHGSRNKNNKFVKFTEDKTDIPNTISIYVNQIKSDLDSDNTPNNKNDENFFNKKQHANLLKTEKKKEKKTTIINSFSTAAIKNIKHDKNNAANSNKGKRYNYKKRMTKKLDKVKGGKKLEKLSKENTKLLKKKSTSFSIPFYSEKMNNNINKHEEIKEKAKEDVNKSIEDDSKSKSKSKIEKDDNEVPPNIIIYGSESSSENPSYKEEEEKSNENKNIDDYFKVKNYSNISTGNNNNTEKTETKITKPRTKRSTNLIRKIKFKDIKDMKDIKPKKARMSRKFTSSNITHKIKLNSKYSSANEREKNNKDTKDKDKDNKKKFSMLKLLTSKNNLFKEDKENKFKHRNSVSKHILSIQQYSQIALKKHSDFSSKEMKDIKKIAKPNSNNNLHNLQRVEEPKKKSNKNLRHNELDKTLEKKLSYNSNMHIPRITINTKSQENDTKDIHLVVKGKEETITNYTNQQMIEDEKDYIIDCLKVLAKLKKEEMPRCKQKVNFNFPPEEKQKKIALFDLDETLVHCNNNEPGMNGDVVSVKLPTNKIVKVGLNIRKNWKNALDLIKNHYHVVIYTASHPSYADAVLDYMDKENKYFKYRLYRSHCIQCDVDGFKFYVKDLDTLDKYYNLKDIVIIDNSILSFAYHLYNGIHIVPFINQPNDTELMFTAHYLISIANYDDLSLENKKHLNLDNLLSEAKILNEIEDNEEEEEEEEDEDNADKSVDKEPDIKNGNNDIVNDNDKNKNENMEESNKENDGNLIKKESGENTTRINLETKTKEDNFDLNKIRGRKSVHRSRKTIKIAEAMKKNIDEMLNKKKKELEKIDED